MHEGKNQLITIIVFTNDFLEKFIQKMIYQKDTNFEKVGFLGFEQISKAGLVF